MNGVPYINDFTHHHHSISRYGLIIHVQYIHVGLISIEIERSFDGIQDQPFQVYPGRAALAELPGCYWENRGWQSCLIRFTLVQLHKGVM